MNEKKMSLMDLVFMGMGGCIGAGIFSMLGVGISLTGRSVWIAFIIAMMFKMTQQIRMVVMASMFSMSGGMYSQQALILTPMLTGVTAITTMASAFSFSVFGISLASYTVLLFPALKPFETILACVMLLVFFLVAFTGVNVFAKVQNLLGISKVIALVMFMIFGLIFILKNDTSVLYTNEPFFIRGPMGFVTAVALMSFTCDGVSNIVNMAQVSEKPKKNIPLAFIIASIACGAIYAGLGFIGSHLGSYESVANQNLGFLAQMVLPKALYIFFIIGGAMASLSTALLGGITGFAPMFTGIAQDGWIPAWFKNIKHVYIFLAIGAMFPIITGFALDDIVAIIMVPATPLGIIVNWKAMKLPEMYPTEWANSGLKLSKGAYKFMMIISILATALTGFFSLASLTLPMGVGVVIATIAIFVYANYRLKSGKVNITSTEDLG